MVFYKIRPTAVKGNPSEACEHGTSVTRCSPPGISSSRNYVKDVVFQSPLSGPPSTVRSTGALRPSGLTLQESSKCPFRAVTGGRARCIGRQGQGTHQQCGRQRLPSRDTLLHGLDSARSLSQDFTTTHHIVAATSRLLSDNARMTYFSRMSTPSTPRFSARPFDSGDFRRSFTPLSFFNQTSPLPASATVKPTSAAAYTPGKSAILLRS